MFKFKLFSVLLFACNLWAVQFNMEVVKEGSGTGIRAGQLIKVHYKGYLLMDIIKSKKQVEVANDSAVADTSVKTAVADSVPATGPVPFANSYESGEPLEFTIGVGQVIPGWEKGLMDMKVGEIRKLTIPAYLGYGENSLDGIPPNSDLYFEVELVHAEKVMEPDVFPVNVEKLKWREASKGLKLFDEKVGSGKPAAIGSVLKVHYTGWLLNGRKFGSSKDLGKPLSVVMGAGKMIKGWESGLDGLREGGVRWLRVAPSMGYGALAYSTIPPNSTLVFRIELISSEVDAEIAAHMDFFPDTASLKFENGPEGLRYAVIKQGEGEPAKVGSTVKVHYTGWLLNGYKFDSSRDRGQEFSFPLGGGRVIRGWELGVAGMLPGEKRILVVPPGLGYGNRAAGPIPGGSTLIFAVEYFGE